MGAPTIWGSLGRGPVRIGYVQAGPVRTRYLEAGDGPDTIVFLHGLAGSLDNYAHVIPFHTPHFRTIAFDWVGCGYSDKPDQAYEIDAYLRHLLDLLDALELRRVHLSAVSLGGWIAARFASRHPERLGKLILNTASGLEINPAGSERMRSLTMRSVESNDPADVRKRIEAQVLDAACVTEDLIDIRHRIQGQAGYGVDVARLQSIRDADVRARNILTPEELAGIEAETLIVWTGHNPTGGVALGERFAAAIPRARLVVINEAGHLPHWETPERFSQIQLDFLLGGRPGSA